MRYRTIVVALAIAVATLAGAGALAQDSAAKTVKGEIVGVDAQKQTVTVKTAGDDPADPKEISVKVDAKTQIAKEGRKVGLSELHAGDAVVLSYRSVGGSAVAVSIGVQPAEP